MTKSMEMSGGGTAVRGQSRYQNGVPGMQQSRLQMLQADFQQKLLKEKEEKMLHLYEENQQRALERINNRQNSTGSGLSRGGSVREFFNERRILNAQGKTGVPPIHQHYSQYQKSPSASAKTYHSNASYASSVSSKSGFSQASNKTYNSANSGRIPQPDYRNSAGRDRAKPLAPLGQRQGLGSPQNESVGRKAPVPPIQQKPRLYQRKPVPVNGKPDYDQNGSRIYQGQIYQGSSRNSDFMADNDDYSSPSPPVNPRKKGTQLRQPTHRDNDQSRSPGNESPQKLTDFQKWQLEQNRTREERLQRGKPKPASDVDEQDSGIDLSEQIRKRQEEIQARLQNQQAELQRVQEQRKEDKDRQKKARQERAEKERQRRLEEQRERQRAAEEERQRLQEERRLAEQNRMEEEEKRRNSQMSHHSRGSTQDYNTPQSQPQQRKSQANKPRRAVYQERRQNRRVSPPPFDAEEELAPVPGPGLDIYEQAAHDSEAFGQAVNLAPCKVCGRSFARDRLPKHQQACKNITKPRKVFDPVKMRTEGTEAAQYVRSNKHVRTNEAAARKKKKNNWRAQHESFIESIRYAKKMSEYEASGGKVSDLPPPPPSDTSSYVQCPHCNRRFNHSVAERHIPKCVNIRAKPRPPPNRRR